MYHRRLTGSVGLYMAVSIKGRKDIGGVSYWQGRHVIKHASSYGVTKDAVH